MLERRHDVPDDRVVSAGIPDDPLFSGRLPKCFAADDGTDSSCEALIMKTVRSRSRSPYVTGSKSRISWPSDSRVPPRSVQSRRNSRASPSTDSKTKSCRLPPPMMKQQCVSRGSIPAAKLPVMLPRLIPQMPIRWRSRSGCASSSPPPDADPSPPAPSPPTRHRHPAEAS